MNLIAKLKSMKNKSNYLKMKLKNSNHHNPLKKCHKVDHHHHPVLRLLNKSKVDWSMKTNKKLKDCSNPKINNWLDLELLTKNKLKDLKPHKKNKFKESENKSFMLRTLKLQMKIENWLKNLETLKEILKLINDRYKL